MPWASLIQLCRIQLPVMGSANQNRVDSDVRSYYRPLPVEVSRKIISFYWNYMADDNSTTDILILLPTVKINIDKYF